MRVVEACNSKSEIVSGLLKHVTQGKARERRDSKQTIVEQRKRRKRKQGYVSESMGKQAKPRASTRELRSPHAVTIRKKPKPSKPQPQQ